MRGKKFGAVNHRPRFSRKYCAKFSAKFLAPPKSVFALDLNSRQISRPFWHRQPVFLSAHSVPLKPQETGEPLRLRDFSGHPILPLSLRATTCRPATITHVIKIKMENSGADSWGKGMRQSTFQ